MGWNISNILVNEAIANKKAGGGGGSSTLAGLTDTDITTPSNGQVLTYDGTAAKWVNASAGGGGGSGIAIAETETKIGTFGGADFYAISTPITSIANTGTLDLTGIPAGANIIGAWGGVTESGVFKPLPFYTNVSSPGPIGFEISYATDKWVATWRCPSAHSTVTGNLVVMYTKPASAENIRKGGKK